MAHLGPISFKDWPKVGLSRTHLGPMWVHLVPIYNIYSKCGKQAHKCHIQCSLHHLLASLQQLANSYRICVPLIFVDLGNIGVIICVCQAGLSRRIGDLYLFQRFVGALKGPYGPTSTHCEPRMGQLQAY